MKKLVLAKETLRRLSPESVSFVRGGLTEPTANTDNCDLPTLETCYYTQTGPVHCGGTTGTGSITTKN